MILMNNSPISCYSSPRNNNVAVLIEVFFCKHDKMKGKHLCIFFQKGKSKTQTVEILLMRNETFLNFTALISFQKTIKKLLKIHLFS